MLSREGRDPAPLSFVLTVLFVIPALLGLFFFRFSSFSPLKPIVRVLASSFGKEHAHDLRHNVSSKESVRLRDKGNDGSRGENRDEEWEAKGHMTREEFFGWRSRGRRGWEGEDLSGLDLAGVDLAGCNLTGADLTGTNLRRARLLRATLSRATLFQADLSEADLSFSRIVGADLSEATLEAASLYEVTLSRSRLTGANLSFSNLTHARLRRADLTECDLTGAVLIGGDLSGATLARVRLTGAILSRVSLEGVHLDPSLLKTARTGRRPVGGPSPRLSRTLRIGPSSIGG